MRILRHPATYLALAWIGFLASVVYVTPRLPDRVASHFGWSGEANGWMSRSEYAGVMLAVGFGLPLFLVVLCRATEVLPPSMVNIPHKEYWLTPERRAQTARWIGRYALWLGAMMALFVTGLNLLTLQANNAVPPRLSNGLVLSLAGLLLVGVAGWCVGFYRQFGQPPREGL